jgi:hypothetical protein
MGSPSTASDYPNQSRSVLMDVDERVALAEAVDGEDLASSLESWAGETPANQLRWHSILASALSPEDEATVTRAEALTVDDLSPVDPTADDPAQYRATAVVDASIERHPSDAEAETDEFEAAPVVIELTATLGRTEDGTVEVLVHDVAAADDEEV